MVRLIFDGDCGFCTSTARLIKRLDWRGRVEIVPWQDPGVLEQAGLTAEQTMEAVWAIEGGRRYRAAEAANLAVARALAFPPLLWLYYVPGIRQLQEWAYRWIAANRYKLPGGTPACALPRPGAGREGQP